MTAWTAGPWQRNIPPATHYPTIYSGRNKHVAIVKTLNLPVTEVEANCNLIAAAPDLYEALDSLLADVGRESSLPGAVKARAALSRVKG